MPAGHVRIDPMDRGFLVGDAVFDVFRTVNGKSFRLREHVDRLDRSLKYVRIDPGLSPEDMFRISDEIIARNEPSRALVGDLAVWQRVTRGRGRSGPARPVRSCTGRWPPGVRPWGWTSWSGR